MYSTKLTSARGFNVDNMIFSKPEVGNIPNSVPKISFKRIKIGTKNNDNTTGELILETPSSLFSFGLQENRELGTGNVNGYVLPICLWNKTDPTKEEKEFTDIIDKIVQKCKTHLLDSKDDIERYDLDSADLKNFNPLYWKKEKGKIVEGTGPVIYIKTMMSKKTDKISTIFINEETNEEMSPYDVMNRYCFVKGAFKFESIFIGNKISLQLKLYEVLVRPIDMERKTLLRPNVVRRVDEPTSTSSNVFDILEGNEEQEEVKNVAEPKEDVKDDGSLEEESSEEEEEDEDEECEGDSCPITPQPKTPTPPSTPKKPVARSKRGAKA